MVVTIRSDDESIEWGVQDEERIIQNVKNIIRTRKFEIPFMRDMGLNPDYIDTSIVKIKDDIIADVIETISAHEDRVEVLNVVVESVNENGEYVVSVELEV